MFSKELLGQRLKEIRLKNGERQEDLAALLGVYKSRVSSIEHGVNTTTAEKLYLICEHYSVSADYLLGLTDEA